jgi:hypothetical protein
MVKPSPFEKMEPFSNLSQSVPSELKFAILRAIDRVEYIILEYPPPE